MSKHNIWTEPDNLVDEETAEALSLPPMYKVLLMDDDYTPMDFVVAVLQQFFAFDLERATQLMLSVHYQGKAICGIFSAEIAEMKVTVVNKYAREHDYPLLCAMEKA